MKLLLRTIVVLLVVCLALPLGVVQAVDDPPYAPQIFYGEVTIGDILAPDETTVSAWIDDVWYASTFTSGGEYLLEVPGDDPAEPGKQGGEPGDTVVFKVSGEVADSQPFEQGMPTPLDLAIAGTPLPPVAEFISNVQSGDEPLTVVFTDESENMINNPTWSWDFGDEGTSTDQDPTHEYLQDGSYTVTLAVTTAYGSDTKGIVDYIVVTDTEPVASFTADPTSGEYPLEVTFTDTSTSHDDITSWAWDFSYDASLGFNPESIVQNPPTYTHDKEGTYTVALRVTEADDDSDMAEGMITVTPPTPPTVLSTLPLDTATDAAIDVVVSATFDEDIQEGANFGDIIIGATVVSASIDGAILTIAHDPFAYETSYTVTIPAGAVDDLDDNPLAEAKVWSFTTLVQYDLIVSSTTGGTVTSPVEETSTHDAGTVVDLVAGAEASYTFVSWSSGDVATIDDVNAASTTILMDSDKSIVANFVVFSAPENVSITEMDPGVESVTVTIEPVEEVDVTEMPVGIDPQEAYVVEPTGTGSFTLVFTDVSNASSIRVYKVVDGTWTLLEVTVIDATTIEVTMDAADPVLVFALPPGEPPVIEYACVYYYTGVEAARPGDLFEVDAMVTDDTAVALVEVETPFGTFPLEGEEYEGIAVYWVFEEVPEDIQPGTYELTLIAEDEDGNTATQSLELEVALSLTAYNVWLADGWNLISLPLIPDATDTETVLDGLGFPGEDMVRAVWGDEIADEMMPILDSVWYYDAAGEYGTAGEWLYFEPDTGAGDLPEMEDGKGYWVDVVISPMGEEASHGALTVYGVELVSGPTTPPTYAVVEGWNLIGFKETRGMPVTMYLSAVEGKYARIYAYDAYDQRFYLVGEGGPDYMQPGSGCWIYMTDDGYIVP